MTTARRAQLSYVMQIAHSWRRQIGCSMSEALRTAWRKVKAEAAPVTRIVHLRSTVTSPASNRLAGAVYGRRRDWKAGGRIAAFGR